MATTKFKFIRMQTLISGYQRILRELGSVYQRNIFKELESNHRITGIVGPRGIGKTTYIIDYLKRNRKNDSRALYVSADDLYFANNSLVDLVEQFVSQYDGRLLCIDEIHKYPNWSQELKNIYDKYRKVKVIFSGSSSIDLIKERYDLSRRAVLRHISGLSFREFLEIKLKRKYPILTVDKIVQNKIASFKEIIETPKLLGFFKEYLQTGYYPVFTEHKTKRDFYEALTGIIEKSVYSDIALYYRLKTSSLPVFKKILYFVHTSSPSSININRIAKSLNKDYSDTANYLGMMRDTGLLRFLMSDKTGHALIRKPEKVYLNNTNLSYALENEIGKKVEKGAIRELFVVSSLESARLKPFYSKAGDLKCGKYIFEVGGKNKSESQISGIKNAYLILDDIITGDAKRIPLYLFGFLY